MSWCIKNNWYAGEMKNEFEKVTGNIMILKISGCIAGCFIFKIYIFIKLQVQSPKSWAKL